MISRIELKNYRNLDLENGLSLDNLNIFVGSNGSGKSNLIRIFKFLQDGLIGVPDPKRGISSYESAVADFGSGRILDATIEKPAVVWFDIRFNNGKDYDDGLQIDFDVRSENDLSIKSEGFYRIPGWNNKAEFYYHINNNLSTGIIKVINNDLHEVKPINHTYNKDIALPHIRDWVDIQISDPNSEYPKDTLNYPVLYASERFFYNIFFWYFYESSNIHLNRIRKTSPELGSLDNALSPTGENLVLVLYNLIRDNVDFEERITDAMRELFPRTKRIRILPLGRLSLSLEWYVEGQKQPFYLDEMSDGTVRMLCWATVLLSPRQQSLIVIDEPEAGIHPAWLRILAGWIKEASRRSQVIISTHSADLLDYFTEEYENVRIFTKSDTNPNNYTVKTLDSNMLKPKLDEGWKLGDLYRVGDPSIGGWPW